MPTFDKALKLVLKCEGGYVNNPNDPGGPTNLGITQETLSRWVGHSVSVGDVKMLTPELVAPIYKARYWDAASCGDLPPALAICVFDWAVNSGVVRSVKSLQQIVGAVPDGNLGQKTLTAIRKYTDTNGLQSLVEVYLDSRRSFYKSLKTFQHFGKGWLSRVDDVESEALKLI